jgi:NAD(P)-dependent dehydrogenase (short-subunit alcohol dehydrogenase family)
VNDRWDQNKVPSLVGKVVLVTGANSGLGLAVAKVFAGRGARVLLACRNQSRAQSAVEEIRAETGDSTDIEIVNLDLASLDSVRSAADVVRSRQTRLDLLVNNAGLMAIDQSRTEDGFETQFGVNHLGHFALTAQLAPLLLSTSGSRIVTMSSMGHRVGRLRLDDLFFEKRGYDRWRPYFQSKLANLLFTAELQRRLTDTDTPTIALAAHPGASHTNIAGGGSGMANSAFRLASTRVQPYVPLAQPASVGALPLLRAATDPAATGGQFYGPHWVFRGYPRLETPSHRARRVDDARRLWERSEVLTGVSFPLS